MVRSPSTPLGELRWKNGVFPIHGAPRAQQRWIGGGIKLSSDMINPLLHRTCLEIGEEERERLLPSQSRPRQQFSPSARHWTQVDPRGLRRLSGEKKQPGAGLLWANSSRGVSCGAILPPHTERTRVCACYVRTRGGRRVSSLSALRKASAAVFCHTIASGDIPASSRNAARFM